MNTQPQAPLRARVQKENALLELGVYETRGTSTSCALLEFRCQLPDCIRRGPDLTNNKKNGRCTQQEYGRRTHASKGKCGSNPFAASLAPRST